MNHLSYTEDARCLRVKGLRKAPCKPHDLKIWLNDANKIRVFPFRAMMANKWGGGIIHLLLTSELHEGEWLTSRPDHLTPWYLMNRKLGGPLSRSARFGGKNILPLPGFEPRSTQSVTQSLYRLPDAHTCCTKCENKVASVPKPHNTELYVSWRPLSCSANLQSELKVYTNKSITGRFTIYYTAMHNTVNSSRLPVSVFTYTLFRTYRKTIVWCTY